MQIPVMRIKNKLIFIDNKTKIKNALAQNHKTNEKIC